MPERDPDYLDFLWTKPCHIRHLHNCNYWPLNRSEAAHVGSDGGMGMKPSDKDALPLCHLAHIGELHQHGKHSFEKKFKVDLMEVAAIYYAEYQI